MGERKNEYEMIKYEIEWNRVRMNSRCDYEYMNFRCVS